MEIPRFPAAPPLAATSTLGAGSRSVSLDLASRQQRRRTEFARRRPRSASWLVARKPSRRRVQPAAATAAALLACDRRADEARKPRLTTQLRLTMTESRCPANADDDESATSKTVLERIRETSPRTNSEDEVNEGDVVYRATITKANKEHVHHITAHLPPLKATLPPIRTELQTTMASANCRPTLAPRKKASTTSVAAQTTDAVLYRLRVLPSLKDIADEDSRAADSERLSAKIFPLLRFLGRVALCQFGLAWLLSLWAVLGAGAFYATEGPRERQQVVQLKDMQRELAIGLATELRQLQSADREMEPLWSNKVRQYVAEHERLLLAAVSSGYGEGGEGGRLWTFPGCLLFAVSVLTTLGFGAPVPRTTAGRAVALAFAAVGIPAHFLLVLNLGLLLAVRLKRCGTRRSCRRDEGGVPEGGLDSAPMPTWVKLAPFVAIGAYYVLGILCFGVARLRPLSDSLLFPLDFTAAGGLSTVAGYVRVLYGLYLEGAVTIAAVAVAVLKVSATQSLTNVGLRYGLLVPA
ncbi:uncharacterized protein LOC131665731 [Phymastichus coffea]|uniref:uncharacterized protein LOC131665731 n=1 Tax=Phymastichus coffea TaxID=108790 RepID=UPI00273BAF7D|nr:uncharacterized protein LOC131665731 [Phymastichus coffea]XP_058793787.1 uncharacterized protein LOC131665731 [Phymastichus coffea]XP_058793788.1 uncharacterized protein LOC131665731 [Phymastichus coffea]